MPYSNVSELPPAFKNLPAGAKTLAMRTINSILEGKEETTALITQAIRAAWSNIKEKYKQSGGKWVAKSADVFVPLEGLSTVHAVLVEEMKSRGLSHGSPWPTEQQVQKRVRVNVTGSLSDRVEQVRTAIVDQCSLFGAKERYDITVEDILASLALVRGSDGKRYAVPYTLNADGTVALDTTNIRQVTVSASITPVQKAAWSRVIKADDEEQVAYGLVYAADDTMIADWIQRGSPKDDVPAVVDTEGDWINEMNLRESYAQFMMYVDRLARSGDMRPYGIEHRVLAPGTTMRQSALLIKGTHWPDPDSPTLEAALNWCHANHYANSKIWQAVKTEGLRAFSLEGLALR